MQSLLIKQQSLLTKLLSIIWNNNHLIFNVILEIKRFQVSIKFVSNSFRIHHSEIC